MTKALVTPRLARILKRMTPITPEQAEAGLERTLRKHGIVEPRLGRPRKESALSTVVYPLRLPAKLYTKACKMAKRARSTPAKFMRRAIAEKVLA
jgi:hypothetical protein